MAQNKCMPLIVLQSPTLLIFWKSTAKANELPYNNINNISLKSNNNIMLFHMYKSKTRQIRDLAIEMLE